MSFQGKTALITGGTSGMGSATAVSTAEKGASVLITGRDETRGASTVEQIRAGGHDAQFIAADFSEMSEVARVADAAGEIDVLVNCAGVAAMGPTVDTDEAAFDGLFQINVKAPFFLVAALAPKIAARGGGSIINVSTMVASYGQPGLGAYGACGDRAAHQGLGCRIRAAERPRQRGRSRSDVDPVIGAEIGDGPRVRQDDSARPDR
jgi:NAD(P)-dependent dehydrogenase (short-subunit alcohol dehydrogenase family)